MTAAGTPILAACQPRPRRAADRRPPAGQKARVRPLAARTDPCQARNSSSGSVPAGATGAAGTGRAPAGRGEGGRRGRCGRTAAVPRRPPGPRERGWRGRGHAPAGAGTAGALALAGADGAAGDLRSGQADGPEAAAGGAGAPAGAAGALDSSGRLHRPRPGPGGNCPKWEWRAGRDGSDRDPCGPRRPGCPDPGRRRPGRRLPGRRPCPRRPRTHWRPARRVAVARVRLGPVDVRRVVLVSRVRAGRVRGGAYALAA